LNASEVIARANAGNGGNITITADAFLQSADSIVDASSRTGLDGDVSIDSLNQSPPVVPVVDQPFLDIADLLNNRCATATATTRSSFVVDRPNQGSRAPGDYLYSSGTDSSNGNAADSNVHPMIYVLADVATLSPARGCY
jgi:hypothetical protein